jgi:hypothetical protein
VTICLQDCATNSSVYAHVGENFKKTSLHEKISKQVNYLHSTSANICSTSSYFSSSKGAPPILEVSEVEDNYLLPLLHTFYYPFKERKVNRPPGLAVAHGWGSQPPASSTAAGACHLRPLQLLEDRYSEPETGE